VTTNAGRHFVTIDANAAGERLDRALAVALPDLTRSRVKALIEGRRVALAGGQTIEEPSRKVKTGERFEIDIPEPEPAVPQPQALALDILYEDADLLVLNKPAGLVVHPAPGNPDNTLVNALLAHCGDSLSGIGGVRRPGIVHRLDKDTSGVMVVAKNDRTHTALSKLFAAHDLERIYQVLVWGAPKAAQGRIEAAIGRHPVDRKRMTVRRAGGRSATTDYWVEKRFGPPLEPLVSLVRARLGTGRTHQVRVHMAHLGCPVVGDPVYGRKSRNAKAPTALREFPRQALHAAVLAFRHPTTGQNLKFATELPQDFSKLVASLNSVK
jgi:23S rRNA pseudouridine1911/1915/1917 synthase